MLWLLDKEVGDGGIEQLQGMAKLRELDISRTQVTNDCMQYLMEIPTLEILNVTDTAVTPEGAVTLKETLSAVHIAPYSKIAN
ncbi:hypothetical protein [Symmachiella macrocystis]|uniref:hypothetical protein n=1 Tax=Symmachiella macrocystis TaxID=2527985 RepID=UPI0011B4096C|nr:hypothetical protein [Symmachiella macrocystis]